MIDKRILRLTPKRFLCPLCGEWHDWEGGPLASFNKYAPYDYECNDVTVKIWVGDDKIFIYSKLPCDKFSCSSIGINAYLDEIEYDEIEPVIKIPFTLYADEVICYSECKYCEKCDYCNFAQIGDNRGEDEDEYQFLLEFKFEFDSRYFNRYSEAVHEEMSRQQCEAEETQHHQQEFAIQSSNDGFNTTTRIKEEPIMAKEETKKTSIRSMLYEKSPKENVETLQVWAEKYKPVLKWAIPVAAVYGAYRILNSNEFDLSVNNIADTCEKKLGFKVEVLENKKALKELMVIGGLSAGAYGAVKAVSGILGAKEEKDISVEEVEAGMSKLDTMSKKFAWIQPKTEDMLPVAFSVIFVYVTLHKPKFMEKVEKKLCLLTEDFQIKFNTYIELAKLFIQDKFNMDLSNEEEQKKLKICVFLIALCGVFAFLYGKKVLVGKKVKEESEPDKEEINESVVSFVEQAKVIIEKIAPTIYTTLVTMLVSKKLLMQEDVPELPEGEVENEFAEEGDISDTHNEEENPKTNPEE